MVPLVRNRRQWQMWQTFPSVLPRFRVGLSIWHWWLGKWSKDLFGIEVHRYRRRSILSWLCKYTHQHQLTMESYNRFSHVKLIPDSYDMYQCVTVIGLNEKTDTWIPKSAEHGIQRLVSSDSNIVSGSTHSHSPSADKTPLVLSHGMHSSSM